MNTDSMGVGTREKMYSGGGIFSITSRILVVDLLSGLLDPATVTGTVVLHAERVGATSLEAFIVRYMHEMKSTPEEFAWHVLYSLASALRMCHYGVADATSPRAQQNWIPLCHL